MMIKESPIGNIPSVAKARGLAAIVADCVRKYVAVLRAGLKSEDTAVEQPMDLVPADANNEIFTHLMHVAHDIAGRDATGLPRLVSAILRPLQAEQILSVAERTQHAARDPIRFDQLFSPDYFFSYFDPADCLHVPAAGFLVDLSRAIVFATPWGRKSFASALAHVGAGKSCGPWRQDPNHDITLLLPWGIAVVVGGNHSIAAGILGHEGVVAPSTVLDLSPLFSRVFCDGIRFREVASGEPVARMRDGRMGALFEIGRLMADQKRL